MTTPFRRRPGIHPALSISLLIGLAAVLSPQVASASDSTMLALGVGVQRMPAWPGANDNREDPLPYIDIELPGIGSISTLNGMEVELLHGPDLHGGIYGSYQWGRTRDDLRNLGGMIPSLSPRLTLGGYLERQVNEAVAVGTNLSHDTNGAGAYLNLYADADLPPIGSLNEAMSLRWGLMNGAAMNRFFGVGAASAATLGVSPWRPSAGSEIASLEYDLYMPLSRHTGLALALVYGRLLGGAANSPLVTRFGSSTQWTQSLAFIYHP